MALPFHPYFLLLKPPITLIKPGSIPGEFLASLDYSQSLSVDVFPTPKSFAGIDVYPWKFRLFQQPTATEQTQIGNKNHKP